MNAKLSIGLISCLAVGLASAFYVIRAENDSLREQTEALRNELRYLPRTAGVRPLLRAAVHPDDARAIPAPRGTEPLVLDLAIDDTFFARYRAILETDEGDVIWVGDHLKRQGRMLAVEIPAGVTEPRKYILRLAGTSTHSAEPIAEFVFRLLAPR